MEHVQSLESLDFSTMTLKQIDDALKNRNIEEILAFVEKSQITITKFWVFARLIPELRHLYETEGTIRTETENLIMQLLSQQCDRTFNIMPNEDLPYSNEVFELVKRMKGPMHQSWMNMLVYEQNIQKHLADTIASPVMPNNIRRAMSVYRPIFVSFLNREFAVIPLSKLIDLLIMRDEIDGKHNYRDDVSLRLQDDAWNEFCHAIDIGDWTVIDEKLIVVRKISEYLNTYYLKFYAERTKDIWHIFINHSEEIKKRRTDLFWKTIIYRYFKYEPQLAEEDPLGCFIPSDMMANVEGMFIALTVTDVTKFNVLANLTSMEKKLYIANNVFDKFTDVVMINLVNVMMEYDKNHNRDSLKTVNNVEDMFYRIVIEDLNYGNKISVETFFIYLESIKLTFKPERLFELTICGQVLTVNWKFIGAYCSDLELLKKLPGDMKLVYGGYDIMCMVAVKGTRQVAQYLKDQGIAVTNKSLEVAIHYKNAELVDFLIENGVRYTGDLSSTSDAIIMAMVKSGGYNTDGLVRILAEQNISKASTKRSLDLFRTIIDSGKYNAWDGVNAYYPLVRQAPDTRFRNVVYNMLFDMRYRSTDAENYFKLFTDRRPSTLRMLAFLSTRKAKTNLIFPVELSKLIFKFLGNSPSDIAIDKHDAEYYRWLGNGIEFDEPDQEVIALN